MQCIAVNVLRKNTNHIWKKFLLKYVSETTDVMSHALKAVAHIFFLTERFFLSPNKEFGKPHVLRSSLRSDIYFFYGQIEGRQRG